MYRPSLRPGEELVKTSPGVTVKNVPFDAFLTSKRIIFVRKTDDFQEKKELVFPLNLVRDFKPSSDESGTPEIRFSIEKPSGEVGDLVLRFLQTGDYRYAERDDWLEDLKNLSRGVVPRHATGGQNRGHDLFSVDTPSGGTPAEPVQTSGAPAARDAELFGASPREAYTPPPVDPGRPPAEYPGQQGFSQPPSAPQASTFCRFCGAKVPSGSVFCPSCGGKMEQQAEMRQPPVSQPPPQSPPVPPVNRHPASPPPPPPSSGGGGFMSPPPPPGQGVYGQQPAYPPRDGGISMADDRAYGYGRGDQISPKNRKAMMKDQARADKARMKEQARVEKEQRKAMKRAQKGGGGYGGYDDPYGYRESRMPEPKILIAIIAVIAVIAVGGYAFTSGMIGGGSVDSNPGGSQSTSDMTANPTNELGSTSTSTSYGNWYFEVLYSGDWSGTYTYNGQTYSVSGFGYQKSPNITDPSGTISISIHKDDDKSGVLMDVALYNSKGIMVASDTSTNPGATVTVDYTIS